MVKWGELVKIGAVFVPTERDGEGTRHLTYDGRMCIEWRVRRWMSAGCGMPNIIDRKFVDPGRAKEFYIACMENPEVMRLEMYRETEGVKEYQNSTDSLVMGLNVLMKRLCYTEIDLKNG